MLKRVLVYFKNDSCSEVLIDFLKEFSKKYNCKIDGIYIKDIRKYDIIPAAAEGMFIDFSTNYILKEWEKYETKLSAKVKENFEDEFSDSDFLITEGMTVDILREKLKSYDLLIMAKSEKLDEITKSILRTHHKPLLLVPKQDEYKFEKVLFADDDEEDANKSIFTFLSLFEDIDNYKSISVGIDKEKEPLKEYFECINKKIEFLGKKCESCDSITEELDNNDVLIMGNMKHSFIYEKLTGKVGMKLLENSKKNIFIG